MRCEREGSVVFDGGEARVSIGYRLGMAVFALLVALFVFVLLAESAWAQDRERRAEKRETRTADNTPSQVGAQQVETQAVDSGGDIRLRKVDDPDPVEENGLLLYTIEVTNDKTNSRDVFIRDELDDSVNLRAVSISGGEGDGKCEPSADEDEVFCEVTLDDATSDDDTATILIVVEPEQVGEIENVAEVYNLADCEIADPNCDSNDRLVRVREETDVVRDRDDGRDDRFRDRFRDRFPPGFFDDPNDFVDEDDDGIPDVFDEDVDEDEDDLAQAEEDLAEAEEDLAEAETTTGEGTTGDGGASADTPGASAQAGGDPDDQPPVSGQRGDVVDEVQTEGPLPNTGGASLWAYALPGLGVMLLGAALMRRFGR